METLKQPGTVELVSLFCAFGYPRYKTKNSNLEQVGLACY